MQKPPTVYDFKFSLVLFIVALVLMFGGIAVSVASGDDVPLTKLHAFKVGAVARCPHRANELVVVSNLETGEQLPEHAYARDRNETIFTAPDGHWLVTVGDQFSLVRFGNAQRTLAQPPAAPQGEPTVAAAKLRIWAYMGDDCDPCDRWKREVLPDLMAREDVQVWLIKPADHDKEEVPAFIVQTSERVVERVGYDGTWNSTASLLALLPAD